MNKSLKKKKTCALCGNYAGKYNQWWNRDNGFGICFVCVKNEKNKNTPEHLISLYGIKGIHYS